MKTRVLKTAGLIAVTIALSTKSGSADQANGDFEGRSPHDNAEASSHSKLEVAGSRRPLRWRSHAFEKAIQGTNNSPIKVRNVTLPTLRVYEEGTCIDRPLIILVHGCPGGPWQFIDCVFGCEKWVGLKEDADLVVVTLPGHGSATGAPGSYSFGGLVGALAQVVVQAHRERPNHGELIVLAESFGAEIAEKVAERCGLVNSLVLISPTGFSKPESRRTPGEREAVNWFLGPLGTGLSGLWGLGCLAKLGFTPNSVAKDLIFYGVTNSCGGGNLFAEANEEFYRSALPRRNLHLMLKLFREEMRLTEKSDADLRRRLRGLGQRCLIVNGSNDQAYSNQGAQFLSALSNPANRLTVIDGVGHLPELQCPELLVRLVRSFIRGRLDDPETWKDWQMVKTGQTLHFASPRRRE